MNKKLRRLLQPSMAVYFVILLLFVGAAFAVRSYWLAGIEAAVTAVCLAGYRWREARRRKAINDYVLATNEMMNRTSGGEVPFPVAMLRPGDGELIWYNRPFEELTELADRAQVRSFCELFPDFSLDWLSAGKQAAPEELRYHGRRFRVSGSPVRDASAGEPMAMLYFQDLTELLQVRDEYIRSRPMVAIVLIDNYEELTNNLPDATISALNAQLNTFINEWADRYGGLLRRLERNRYLLLLEAKVLAPIAEEKFSLLESIRTVTNPAGVAATVSIGIGKDGVDFREDYDFAALSIEMSLSRGGDQAVVKDRYDFAFFGGRIQQNERRTKVKSRVMASSLSELIAQSGQVFIMGHKMADLDAVGAAVGVCCLCRKKGKTAHIVIDLQRNASASLISLLRQMPEYAETFVSDQEALLAANPNSLLVVVDTNRPDQVECKSLLEAVRRVVVIDHHRRAADYIEQPVLSLHETSASSASELVTELLQYSVEPTDILPNEAAALLAGIVLDTKNFSLHTGSRTFEAAAFLRRIGADTVEVKKLFQNDLSATVARFRIVQTARLYRANIAIAALDYTVTRTLAAQAADELLNISGVEASFVLYPQDDQVNISARSIGDANVQIILEPLGGGGNAATAGAQMKNTTVPAAYDALITSINKYYN